MNLNLLGSTSRVETPIIYAIIGKYLFSINNKAWQSVQYGEDNLKKYIHVPNFLSSLTAEKINGTINTYTVQMIYAIRNGDDPNFLEKVFSSISDTRKITLSYGDSSLPNFIYKNEEALITEIKSNTNIQSSVITYTLTCTSTTLSLGAGTFNFGKVHMKPSDRIKQLLLDPSKGLQDIFYGMRNYDLILSKGLIAGDDIPVDIEAQTHVSILQYLKYLVDCMTSDKTSSNSIINKTRYVLTVVDDTSQIFSGPYFKVTKIQSNQTSIDALDVYELEIGTHSKDMIKDFQIEDNETYSILYKYSQETNQSNYIYRINNEGSIDYNYSPSLSNSSQLLKTSAADKTWWTTVTQYPIKCNVTLKGLLRPAILMSYVRLSVYFYGNKHLSSGLYIITKQVDTVDSSGSSTVLSLTRVGGDES